MSDIGVHEGWRNSTPFAPRKLVSWPVTLFFLLIVIPVFLPVALESLVMGYYMFFVAAWWIFSRRKIPEYLAIVVGPLVLLVAIGLLGAKGHQVYDVLKDAWYVGNAAMVLVVGYVLMANLRDMRRLLRIFVIAGFVVAIFHLVRFALNPSLLTGSATDIRLVAGGGFFAPCLAIPLIVLSRRMGIAIFGKHSWFTALVFLVCALSLVAAFSRTMWLALMVMVAAGFGLVSFNNPKRVALFGVALAALLAAMMSLPAPHMLGAHPAFLDKVLYSVQELKIQDYRTMAEINHSWRGYESGQALKGYLSGNPWEYVVGKGFGTLVDLDLYMTLGGERIRYAPILHNGYMYLLVKTGLVGLLLYLLMLVRIIRIGSVYSRLQRADLRYTGRLIVGLALLVMVTTFVVTGIFNKTALIPATLLLGALLGYMETARQVVATHEGNSP